MRNVSLYSCSRSKLVALNTCRQTNITIQIKFIPHLLLYFCCFFYFIFNFLVCLFPETNGSLPFFGRAIVIMCSGNVYHLSQYRSEHKASNSARNLSSGNAARLRRGALVRLRVHLLWRLVVDARLGAAFAQQLGGRGERRSAELGGRGLVRNARPHASPAPPPLARLGLDADRRRHRAPVQHDCLVEHCAHRGTALRTASSSSGSSAVARRAVRSRVAHDSNNVPVAPVASALLFS